MEFRRSLLTILLVLMMLVGLFSLLVGCESKPAAPQFDNGFDSGDPLQVSVTATDTTATVKWTQPQNYGIATYDIFYSFTFDSGFSTIGSVDHTTSDKGTFVHNGIEPTRTHFYKVKAISADGSFSVISAQAAASAVTRPLLTVGDGSGEVADRNVNVSVTVSMGDSLRIADNPDFDDEQRVAITELGQAQDIAWDLGSASDNGESKSVYVLAFSGVVLSDTAMANVAVQFEPRFSATGDPETVASSWLSLEVAAAGVISMRFALGELELAQQPWLMGAEVVPYFLLADSANPQEIYGEFQGTFGFNHISTWTAVPDLLTDTSFRLAVPANHVSDVSLVTVVSDAAALQMRFSESLDFNPVPWVAYQDTTEIALSSGAGRKVIYAQYRNDWAESAIMTDYVDYITQPLDLIIVAPDDGAILRSGLSLWIRGQVLQASGGAAVDSVKIDTGDGEGFGPVDNVGSSWFYLWDVPAVAVDTDRVLRARAWAGADSVTALLNVTLSDLYIKIIEPVESAQVDSGSEAAVSGVAQPFLAGAPVDSVTVLAGGENLTVTGSDEWSANWSVPVVDEDMPAVVIATVHAGAEAVSDTVNVSIVVGN